jgi:hypothetical protein
MKRILAVLLIFAPAMLQAQDLGTEVTPYLGYRFGGTFQSEDESTSYEMRDSSSFGLLLNFRHRGNTQWEVLYSQQSSEALYSGPDGPDPVVDADIHVLQLGGTYRGEGEVARPYLAATIGGTHIRTSSAGSGSDTFFSGSIGVGMMFMPRSRVGIRVEARAYGTLVDSSSSLFCSTGPDQNICAVRIDGKMLTQVETFAGITFRF